MAKVVVFCGSDEFVGDLGKKICKRLGIKPGKVELGSFANGERRVKFKDNLRRRIVFIIQSFGGDVNAASWELFNMLNAAKLASAGEIHAILPNIAYMRQDSRGENERVPISAQLMAKFIKKSGAHSVTTDEPHAKQIGALFSISVDIIFPRTIFMKALMGVREIRKAWKAGMLVMVSPDGGGALRADNYSRVTKAGLAIVTKRRNGPNQSEAIAVSGEVRGRVAVIVDDMGDTLGTLDHAGEKLYEAGATAVYAMVTHPILSKPAVERLEKSRIKMLFVSDSLPLRDDAKACKKIQVVSLAKLHAEAILANINGESVSKLSRHRKRR